MRQERKRGRESLSTLRGDSIRGLWLRGRALHGQRSHNKYGN